MQDLNSIKEFFKESYNLPPDMIFLYARFWQLESWLRQMVYIELRSLKKDWESFLLHQRNKDQKAKDKRLTHMLTSHENPLSYLTFGELWEIILQKDLWSCFSVYFPPKDILEVKLKEVSQIRHRVAHFRIPHRDDLSRIEQFLRDVDQGFWKFCTSYNNTFFTRQDKLTFTELLSSKLSLTIERSIRPWVDTSKLKRILGNPNVSESGVIYNVVIVARDQRIMRYKEILQNTKDLHKHCIHIILDDLCDHLRLTFPSILSLRIICNTIEEFLKVICSAVWGAKAKEMEGKRVAAEWPEYVLSSSNPLSFLDPDMPCSFFSV